MSNIGPVSPKKRQAVQLAMQYTMQVFEYEEDDTQFRVLDRSGEPWFVLSEVCKKLGIVNVSDAARRVDDDEKDNIGITDAIGRNRATIIINESGLYTLVLRSSKPEAKRFKKWVTSEVLPSIRKTGAYNGRVPAFIKRFNENWDRVPASHFSVIKTSGKVTPACTPDQCCRFFLNMLMRCGYLSTRKSISIRAILRPFRTSLSCFQGRMRRSQCAGPSLGQPPQRPLMPQQPLAFQVA